MKNILLWIWQFPQNIVGAIMAAFKKGYALIVTNDGEDANVYLTDNVAGCGVSLGNYILLDYNTYYEVVTSLKGYALKTVNHEHGHQKQSRYLGIFYLLLIGLPSACGNIYDRLFHKKWTSYKRCKWYYNQPWEKWADKLGGVTR